MGGIKQFLRRLAGRNIWLYSIYHRRNRPRIGKKTSFFPEGTELYIDGYPRSGNTFLVHLCRRLFPDITIASHLHKIAPIRFMLRKGVRVLITFRDPLESVSSNYLMYFSSRNGDMPDKISNRVLRLLLNDYIEYYSFVLKHRENLSLVSFRRLTSETQKVADQLAQVIRQPSISEPQLAAAVSSYKASSESKANPLISMVPTPEKDRLKEGIRDVMRSEALLEKAQHIYKELLKLQA